MHDEMWHVFFDGVSSTTCHRRTIIGPDGDLSVRGRMDGPEGSDSISKKMLQNTFSIY